MKLCRVHRVMSKNDELTMLLVVLSTDSICKCKPYNAPRLKRNHIFCLKDF